MVIHATDPVPRRWTVDEYYRLGELGFFEDQRTELIDGEIIVMPPRLEEHSYCVMRARRALDRALSGSHLVREEKPVRFNTGTEPEPDLAVVTGNLDLPPMKSPPAGPCLVIEVSVTTLASDRKKTGLYARAGVQECWILDVRGRKLEIYRRPEPAAGVTFGFRYGDVRVLEAGEAVTPMAENAREIAVTDLLPPTK